MNPPLGIDRSISRNSERWSKNVGCSENVDFFQPTLQESRAHLWWCPFIIIRGRFWKQDSLENLKSSLWNFNWSWNRGEMDLRWFNSVWSTKFGTKGKIRSHYFCFQCWWSAQREIMPIWFSSELEFWSSLNAKGKKFRTIFRKYAMKSCLERNQRVFLEAFLGLSSFGAVLVALGIDSFGFFQKGSVLSYGFADWKSFLAIHLMYLHWNNWFRAYLCGF